MESEYAHIINRYAEEVVALYATGATTEHSFRGAMERMLRGLMERFEVVNEPKRSECGAPDFALMGKEDGLPYAYIEAKDLFDGDLRGTNAKGHKEQFDRYKNGLARVAFTDYLKFVFYVDGVETDAVRLLRSDGKGGFCADDGERFVSILTKWADCGVQGIGNATRLAEVMAHKARLLADVLGKTLKDRVKPEAIYAKYEMFRDMLIGDLTEEGFADVFAQTIAYGMFAARKNAGENDVFTRKTAADYIPTTNPFLRNVFNTIAGFDLDRRVRWIVDDLAEVFAATDVSGIMGKYQRNAMREDPLIHFYEDFLAAYDPKLRKACGVYYTPQPVVEFIVRMVDEILVGEFKLKDGLADSGKVEIEVRDEQTNRPVMREFHRVHILDPATGTGTFLAEAVKRIYSRVGERSKGMWPQYVEECLKPRLHGFELLMAPYTITHLKLDMMFNMGVENARPYSDEDAKRTQVYLTNSLQESQYGTARTFDAWMAQESREAKAIKSECPVMVMIGNPPYSVSSSNRGEWIQGLLRSYKEGLDEKKLNLDDDYIKFIRLGQYYIERRSSGILGYISNNSYLDGLTHRQMRKALLTAFDDIYIVNLHGNGRKKETTPDGGKDENVFDIMVGTAIAIFVKKEKSTRRLARVHYTDLYGKRKVKFEALRGYGYKDTPWQKLECKPPYYFFVPKDFALENEYKKGVKIDELYKVFNSGVKTDRDSVFIDTDKDTLAYRIERLLSKDLDYDFIHRYNIKDSSSYKLTSVIDGKTFDRSYIKEISYRPLDKQYIYYDPQIISRPADKAMRHILSGENVGLAVMKVHQNTPDIKSVCVANNIIDVHYCGDQTYFFPLYLYDEKGNKSLNMKVDLLKDAMEKIGGERSEKLCDAIEKNDEKTIYKYAEEFFAYIYAVMHSESYKRKYSEFLKIDFPRVPMPESEEEYKRLAKKGQKLINLHLMKGDAVDKIRESLMPKFPVAGSCVVGEVRYEKKRVWINEAQYFEEVSEEAWGFYVGGYQVAQKWLKDRRGRKLTAKEMEDYRRVIGVIGETMRVMEEIG